MFQTVDAYTPWTGAVLACDERNFGYGQVLLPPLLALDSVGALGKPGAPTSVGTDPSLRADLTLSLVSPSAAGSSRK